MVLSEMPCSWANWSTGTPSSFIRFSICCLTSADTTGLPFGMMPRAYHRSEKLYEIWGTGHLRDLFVSRRDIYFPFQIFRAVIFAFKIHSLKRYFGVYLHNVITGKISFFNAAS